MAQASNAKVQNNGGSKSSNLFAGLTILFCIVIGFLVWQFIMGDGSHFQGGVNTGQPLQGDYLGMVYKGGYIVPVLMGLLLMTIVFSFERFFVISKAAGKGDVEKFVKSVQGQISSGDIQGALDACDKQQGSVANVVKAGLIKYQEVKRENFDTEKASEVIQKEIEQATSLEMPMLEKNLTILSTLVSLGTLLGLMGTVSGMIKAFAGLATSGTPDQAELANGISEALINTLTGITTSALAVVVYNYFTSKIDTLTYFIDEAGFTITQAYRRATNRD
ncbi:MULTISPECIES: MotA/TolQ/ExbB proton channel family protein [Flavobacterium]|jgi:biopolymer transport protein ExbB|uniref:Biopolymer transport protein ExbB n=1 Tax=Flavobacterium lindanitolerans TaxID=428988 RepID=A0A497VA17_9FLAO|nr:MULTISPECIES: MotA/TolQ/ExbB proton channel family protein [Flavobacterium]OJX50865.1 MAG: flagellar motor protein MotA [Flavobacterium sp. 38-13]PKW28419.1 outer membrane transport energization protein ExbB [Flavobacterium lindanitolerans]RLJ36076.1 biopolymer transport protein ExbB [Flavobacterium lindanitolerans]THD33389.1 MAG: MotA/TolQ/ExbB proton channel family protein [Flavobacterium johnsoniae]